jgi:hypothetical protein
MKRIQNTDIPNMKKNVKNAELELINKTTKGQKEQG